MTKRLTDEELAEIKERAEKATAGKWRVDYGVTAYDRTVTTETFEILCENVSPKDAEFIAHAREDIPKLLAEIERYREALEEIARGRFSGASYKARQALEAKDK